jgi:hypothetical protein
MSREEIQKLLGGYATNTLTAEEQQALFAAALEDQELFDALGREQSLRDLLRDPAARGHLLAALDGPAPAPWFRRWWKPLPAAAVATALATVAIVAIVAVRRHSPAAPPATVAKLEPSVPSPVAALPSPVPAPAPALAPAGRLPSRADAVVAKAKKLPPASMPMAPAPAPPVPLPPKDVAPKERGEFAVSAGTQMVRVQASAAAAVPQAVSLDKTAELRNLPAAPHNAVTTGAIAEAKATAASPDARMLFYGTLFGGGGGGRAGAVGGIASGAAGIRPLAKTATAAPAVHLGIQYRILRKTDSGDFVEADAAATGLVAAGTTFKLQITANDSGYVRILQEAPDGAWREIVNRGVERMQPIETEPIELDQPGRVKFYLAFARQPLPPSNVAQPDDDIVVDRGRVVTVAGRAAAARQLSFHITLTVQ